MSTSALYKSSGGIQMVPVESKLMSEHRRLFITREITEDCALDFVKQMMYLNEEDDRSPISVFISSPGGEIDRLTSSEHYFTAKEAVEMGLSDGIRTFREMMEV